MLGALEQRLLELVVDALEGRDHLTVEVAGPPASPAAGEGAVRVGLLAIGPVAGFEPRLRPAPPGDAPSRLHRPLRLSIEASIDVAHRPDGDAAATRRLALDDLSIIGHALDATEVRDGSAFASGGPDAGFVVTELRLASGEVPVVADDGTIRATWVYRGLADIWPPVPPEDAGTIDALTLLATAQPLAIDLSDATVRLGETTRVAVRGLPAHRPGPAGPVQVQVAVRVRSTLPPAGRGTVTSGTAATEAGVRLIPVADAVTELEYHAPATMPGGAQLERVEVFLARGDGSRSLLLGSIAVPLREAP